MVSAFTPNIQLEQPARGDLVGTWDTPVNSNTGVLDTLLGGVSSIALNNTNVVLATGQFQAGMLLFNSTLTGSVSITFPTSFVTSYEIQNICSGSSSFTITLKTTAAGGQVVCCPPGEVFEIRNDGKHIKFKNFGRIGSYWDYGGSSVPNWVSGCTIPPYLYCNGAAFSSATYPALATIMQTTTLPDSRGRGRFSINDGTARIVSSNSMNGNTIFNGGGDDRPQYHTHLSSVGDPGHHHTYNQPATTVSLSGGAGFGSAASTITSSNTTGITIAVGLPTEDFMYGNTGNMPPAYMGGITLIRSA